MTVKKTIDGDEEERDTDVDHGYAWVILAGCFVMYCFVIGSIKAYGILYTEMVSYYGTGSGNTAWIGSMVLLLLLGLSPVANLLSRKFTFRRVAFVGGVLLCLGHFLSGFVRKMELMFLTLGVCGGLGYGLSFSPCSTIISYYFKKHRALANGIVVSGSGIGALTYPALYRFLVDKYTLPGAFWVIGGMLLHVCAAACVFRQPPLLLKEMKHTKPRKQKQQNQETLLNGEILRGEDNSKPAEKCFGLDFRFSLFKNPRFTMYCLAFVLCMNGHGNNLILIPAHIEALGYDKNHAVYGVTIMGGCEVVARIGFGWIADQKLLKRKHIFLISMFIASVFCFVTPLFDSFVFMAVFAGIIGTFPGSFWSLASVLIIDVVGLEDFTPAFGLVMLSLAFGVTISQPTVGWLEDYTGSWNASFILTGFLFLFAGLIVSMEPVIMHCFSKRKPDEIKDKKIEIILKEDILPEKTPGETGSLLGENDIDETFTSARISRTYRAYDSEKRIKGEHNELAPLSNKNNI